MLYFFIGTTVLCLGAFVVTYAVMMKFLWRNRVLIEQNEKLQTANKNLMGAYRKSTTEHWAELRSSNEVTKNVEAHHLAYNRTLESEIQKLKSQIDDHFLMPTYKPWQRPAA